jgi:hypothetical protein
MCRRRDREAARTNAKAALMIFVPGADMPVLTAVQMRMVLAIGACYGENVSTDRAVELLSVLGAGFGFGCWRASCWIDAGGRLGRAERDRVLGHASARDGRRRVLRPRRGRRRLAACGRSPRRSEPRCSR